MKRSALLAAAAYAFMAAGALAGGNNRPESWPGIRAAVFADRQIVENEAAVVTIEAATRATDDRTVPVTARAAFADGRTVKALTLVIDENPMPVSAVFALDRPAENFGVSLNMRFNGPSRVRAIVEASDGRLYMTSTLVKTSGLGACAAPPVTDTEEALATLGNMDLHGHRTILADTAIKPKTGDGQVRLDLSHPQHSGMQMDQISLLFIPARYLKTLEVWGGSEKYFTMEGSISLSENPSIVFDLPDGDRGALKVRVTDTENAMFERVFPLGGA